MGSTAAGSAGAAGDTSPQMPHIERERYAVVSCHVERPLDDATWAAFGALQERRPGGFAIAALMRPPDAGAGEDERRWLARAREAAARGPLGHHTHWTGVEHARPAGAGEPGARVRREGVWLREQGLAPTLFCGGGWYTDAGVAAACAELGYADCTPRPARPPYLDEAAPRAELAAPAWLRLESGARLLALPTTRSLGALVRSAARGGPDEPVCHVYCHDTDLLGRRGRALVWALRLLARRRRASDLDALARELGPGAPELPWAAVARPAVGAPAAE
jgi:hypothetical protein